MIADQVLAPESGAPPVAAGPGSVGCIVRRAVTAAHGLVDPVTATEQVLGHVLAAAAGNRTAMRAAQARLARLVRLQPADDLGRRALQLLRVAEARGTWTW
jgi:hypothetical protein